MSNTIAISYARSDVNYNEKVLGFANFLRENGYDVTLDEYYKQEQTAIDFNEMMSKMITTSDKVIVILSEDYKRKADDFVNGVGTEYRIIVNDINSNPRKYIFIVFADALNTQVKDLIPASLGNREVILVNKNIEDSWRDKLFSKLSDSELYVFDPVSSDVTLPRSRHPVYGIEDSRKSVKKRIRMLLLENKRFWSQYGPSSSVAINSPLSDSVKLWRKCKVENIIPNNRKIIEIFEDNSSLFNDDEIQVFMQFKIHAFSFENNQAIRQDNEAVVTFPEDFERMIEED